MLNEQQLFVFCQIVSRLPLEPQGLILNPLPLEAPEPI